MDKELIITIVLAVLVVISVVQAVEINSLKTSISTGNIATVSANTPSSSGSAAAPSNIQNLPEMVGGC